MMNNSHASTALPFTMSFQLAAPLYEVWPVVALALLDAEGVWLQRPLDHAATWQWEEEGSTPPALFQLTLGPSPHTSLLQVEAPTLTPTLQATLEQVANTLRQYEFDLTPLAPDTPAEEPPLALLVAPRQPPFLTLAPLVNQVVTQHGLRFSQVDVSTVAENVLRRAMAEAALVIGVWESPSGRTALYWAWSNQRPLIALARTASTGSGWLGPLISYSQGRDSFQQALEQAIQKQWPIAAPSQPSPPLPPPAPSATPPAAPVNGKRRHIYRQVAEDRQAPPDQRLHAARVLHESGDDEGAARVLGQLVYRDPDSPIAAQALELLGDLGAPARAILWYLDAQTLDPWRAIPLARQLARAGDVQTALFRLERLVQHPHEAVRLAAFEAIAALGLLAHQHFADLAESAQDPAIRLRAIEILHEQAAPHAPLLPPLIHLAAQDDAVQVAARAVQLIAALPLPEAEAALLQLAERAPSRDARLAAAEILMQRGEQEVARAALLRLALGTEELAAAAILDDWLEDPPPPSDELPPPPQRHIRIRAASLLGQPLQPPEVQQAAARVFLALHRPQEALPILARLASLTTPIQVELCRWAAQQLVRVGEEALEEIRQVFAEVRDPVAGQYLAEGLLASSSLAMDRYRAAHWLAEHSNLPRAVEVLTELAASARVSGSDAVQATNTLSRYAKNWAGAARALAILVTDSPHPAVRARALDLLLREFPAELPLTLLVDLAITGSIGAADRSPVMEQLAVLARPAAQRIVARLHAGETSTERRWGLLHLMSELPTPAVTPALLELSARAPQNRIRYVAAQQLIARGQWQAGYAALATIAINEPDGHLREVALYELAQGLPATDGLLRSVIQRTHYQESFHLARQLRHQEQPSLATQANLWLDDLLLRWYEWVATLPLGWLDRLFGQHRS